MFSDHSGIELDISYEKMTQKFPCIWKLSNIILITLMGQRSNDNGN